MCVCNKDRSPARIHGCNTAPTPTGFAEIVGDDFPVLHAIDSASFALHSREKLPRPLGRFLIHLPRNLPSTPNFRMKTLALFLILGFGSLASADDFKTINGKEYKNVT